MKKKIIIAATFATCLALCTAVWPQTEVVEEIPLLSEIPAVTDSQPALPEPEKLEIIVTTEKETVKASEMEIPSEATTEGLSVPASETEKQPEAEQENEPEPAPALVPPTELEYEPTPEPKPEVSDNSSEDMVYVPGFGWIESQGPNHVEYAEDMYENGNKIGIMG